MTSPHPTTIRIVSISESDGAWLVALLSDAVRRHAEVSTPTAAGIKAVPATPHFLRDTEAETPDRALLLFRDPRELLVAKVSQPASDFPREDLDTLARDESQGLGAILEAMNAQAARAESSGTVLPVRLDELLLETPGTLERILRFCGIEASARACKEAAIQSEAPAEPGGNWWAQLPPGVSEYCRQRMSAELHPLYRRTSAPTIGDPNAGERISALEKKSAALEQKIAELAETLAAQRSGAAENATLIRSLIQHSRRTLFDCATRIESFSSNWMFFPVRNRLQKLGASLKHHGQELAAPRSPSPNKPKTADPVPAAVVPRSSNPYHDKFSTDYLTLKAGWKKNAVPAAEQERQWLQFRRDYFAESGEVEHLKALAGRHAGKRCFIIGNGPSLNEQDLSFLRDEVTLVSNWFVNATQYSLIEPKYYCVSSHEMFGGWNKPEPFLNQDYYLAMQQKARGAHKFFSFAFKDYITETGLFPDEKVNYMLFERPKRLVDEVGEINLDLTRHLDDGYTVIQTMCAPLAAHLGCTEIYLIGCDCNYGIQKQDDPKQYCYDSKLHTTATTKFESLQRIWAENGPVFKSYEILGETLRNHGVQLFNATHGGRLDVLPRVDYRSLFP